MKIQRNRQMAKTGLLLVFLAVTVLIQGCMSQANGSVDEIAADTLPRPPEHGEFGEVSLAEITELVTVEATKQGSSQETIAMLVDEVSMKWLESITLGRVQLP